MRLSDHRKILRGEIKLVGIKRHTTLPHEIRIYQLHQRLYLAIHLLPRRGERGREYVAKTIGHRHEKQLLLMITIRILLLLLLLFPYLRPKFFSFTFFSRYLRVSSLMSRLSQAHQGSSEGWNQPLGWGRGAAQGDSASLQHLPQSIRWDFGITERWRRRRIKVLYEYFIRFF